MPKSITAVISGLVLLGGGTVGWGGLAPGEPKAAATEFFETRIRPVLVERCYKCHSSESEKIKGGLLLDTREGLLKGGETGPVIVPGDAEKSRLIEAIRYTNDELKMPPKQKLSDSQIGDFVAWVSMGAPDPRGGEVQSSNLKVQSAEHWAFKPVGHPPIPETKAKSWIQTPIDAFILAKLEEKKLAPSPGADKRTLIRRAAYNLTGLPPTAEEVDEFLNDKSRDAFAKVVDRLLASPRYGERWGRFWLDVARYADTKGYVYSDREESRFVQSAAYRDWVIRALNDDMPYDRFLRLQIAADQIDAKPAAASNSSQPATSNLQPATANPNLAAMGFLTLGRRFLGVVHDIIDDRIDVVMRGTQALTVGCARCHDHKFDPIPTRDYYSVYGVFPGCSEKMVSLAPVGADAAAEEYEKGLRERIDKYQEVYQKRREEFSNRFRTKAPDYLVAVLDVKKLPSEEFYEIRGPDDLNPTVVRSWENYLVSTKTDSQNPFAPWHELAAIPTKEFSARAADTLKRITEPSDSSSAASRLVLKTLSDGSLDSMRDVAERYGKLLAGVHQHWQSLVQSALTNKMEPPKNLPDPAEEELRLVLYGTNAPVNIPELSAVDLEWYFDEGARVELMKLHSEIERWIIKSKGAPPHAVILEDRPVQKNPRVFVRGNPANKGDEVPRQFLSVLAGPNRKPFGIGSGRLEMAEAVASKDNPLTARVMVNRVWQHHFGAGLVRTPSDFGLRSERPSHPELLDWLATHFMEDGWSLKKLHRLIMLSSVYQQSSDNDNVAQNELVPASLSPSDGERVPGGQVRGEPAARVQENLSQLTPLSKPTSPWPSPPVGRAERETVLSPQLPDPENRLLWHFNRQRLDFEALRDSLLLASGELDLTAGGAPVDLFKQPFSTRRTTYGFIDRQFLPGLLRVFDFANPDMHSPQRSDTTVPQQALFLMNSPFVNERSRALAQRARSASAEDQGRIEFFYRTLFQRKPTSHQLETGLQFIKASEALPPPDSPKPVVPIWQYGYGEYDEAGKRINNFEPLPHFTGESWQGGEKWPDEKLGWVRLTADGGHAGNDLQHAAVRRWITPFDATISITGSIKHEHKEGDGIQARVVSSRHGLLGSWTLQNDKAEPKLESVAVKKGDTIDFAIDFRADLNNDDFKWAPVIKLVKDSARLANAGADYTNEWNAKRDFSGPATPPPQPLDAWEKYAQVLLLSNEFMFVD